VLVLDDLGYVRKDQAETTVLFELIAERYERKSLITTCNQTFSDWNRIFPEPAMTVAAIGRSPAPSARHSIEPDILRHWPVGWVSTATLSRQLRAPIRPLAVAAGHSVGEPPSPSSSRSRQTTRRGWKPSSTSISTNSAPSSRRAASVATDNRPS
jgi:hypothetical protein